MIVTLHPVNQLDLAARKLLLARILRLARKAQFESEFYSEMSEMERPFGGFGEAADLGDEFVQIIDSQINKAINKDVRDRGNSSLIDFLEGIADQIEEASSHRTEGSAADARKELKKQAKLFDCAQCGLAGQVCNDTVFDRDLIGHPKGGRCLKFIKHMVEVFTLEAERCYRDMVDRIPPGPLIPPITLETSKDFSNQGTLPIDGEFEQPSALDPAIMRIYWPIDDQSGKLDEAIRSLPYLVFHEVFVHGTQGAARQGPRFQVYETCAFTEGAVDAVACDLLLRDVLGADNDLEPPLSDLSEQMEEACKEYHHERFTKVGKSMQDMVAPGAKIRTARYLGRKKIYEELRRPLKAVDDDDGEAVMQNADWCARAILTLNLYLDKDQRKEFFKSCMKLSKRQQERQRLRGLISRFMEDLNPEALMASLKCAGG